MAKKARIEKHSNPIHVTQHGDKSVAIIAKAGSNISTNISTHHVQSFADIINIVQNGAGSISQINNNSSLTINL